MKINHILSLVIISALLYGCGHPTSADFQKCTGQQQYTDAEFSVVDSVTGDIKWNSKNDKEPQKSWAKTKALELADILEKTNRSRNTDNKATGSVRLKATYKTDGAKCEMTVGYDRKLIEKNVGFDDEKEVDGYFISVNGVPAITRSNPYPPFYFGLVTGHYIEPFSYK